MNQNSLDQLLEHAIKRGTAPDEVQQAKNWYLSRPAAVQQKIDQYPPYCLYRNKAADGQIVQIYSYEEGDDEACTTCSVLIRSVSPLMKHNAVYGVPFEDLENIGEMK